MVGKSIAVGLAFKEKNYTLFDFTEYSSLSFQQQISDKY